MMRLLRSLKANKRLINDFVRRDLKARYVGSSMGFFWSVVFPIINLFVYMFVFRLVLHARFSDKQGPTEVALLMLAGIIIWSAFAESLSRTTNSLIENSNLIQKVVFPAEILPVYLVCSSLVNMCIGLPVLLVGVFWFGHINPVGMELASLSDDFDPNYYPLSLGLPLVLLPLLFLLQALWTVGLGYFLSTLNLFVRDVYHLVGVFTTVWMFATPIFYSAAHVEKAGFGWMLMINPMHWLIESYRSVLCYGVWPDWTLLGSFAVAAVGMIAVGGKFFMSQKARIPDLL